MLDWCTKKVYYIVYKFMSVTLSVITGGLYTIISESKFTQPGLSKNVTFGHKNVIILITICKYPNERAKIL